MVASQLGNRRAAETVRMLLIRGDLVGPATPRLRSSDLPLRLTRGASSAAAARSAVRSAAHHTISEIAEGEEEERELGSSSSEGAVPRADDEGQAGPIGGVRRVAEPSTEINATQREGPFQTRGGRLPALDVITAVVKDVVEAQPFRNKMHEISFWTHVAQR